MSTGAAPNLTQEGAITGSPLYMSPEQAIGDSEPDARSDIYSLGVVAYYLLSGRPPFDYDSPIKVLLAHAQEEPADLNTTAPLVPDDLRGVVMRCMAKNPGDRYQDVIQLARALRQCRAHGGWDWDAAAQWWRDLGVTAVQPATVPA